MELHHRFDPNGDESVSDVKQRVIEETTVVAPLPEDRFFENAFGHIFAGGYSAGYYSYKWAEVLSADAFGAFEEAGLDDDAKVVEMGLKFRDTVLAQAVVGIQWTSLSSSEDANHPRKLSSVIPA